MSDFCSPLLSQLFACHKELGGGGTERGVHSLSFCRSITVVRPCNPINHWLAAHLKTRPLVGQLVYLGSRWQLAEMEGPYSKHGARERARVRCNLHSQKMSPVRLFSAYRNQVMGSHLYFPPCLTFGSFPSLVFCISHSPFLLFDSLTVLSF